MEIYYGIKKVNQNFLSPSETSVQPNVRYYAGPDLYYTLILHDPDAVTDTGYYIHWVITNIPGDSIEKADIILPYTGPKPPKIREYIDIYFLYINKKINFINISH